MQEQRDRQVLHQLFLTGKLRTKRKMVSVSYFRVIRVFRGLNPGVGPGSIPYHENDEPNERWSPFLTFVSFVGFVVQIQALAQARFLNHESYEPNERWSPFLIFVSFVYFVV